MWLCLHIRSIRMPGSTFIVRMQSSPPSPDAVFLRGSSTLGCRFLRVEAVKVVWGECCSEYRNFKEHGYAMMASPNPARGDLHEIDKALDQRKVVSSSRHRVLAHSRECRGRRGQDVPSSNYWRGNRMHCQIENLKKHAGANSCANVTTGNIWLKLDSRFRRNRVRPMRI